MRDRELIIKRVLQFLFALAGVAAGVYVSPLLAVPLTIQFGLSAKSMMYLQIGLPVAGALLGWLIASPVLKTTVAMTKRAEGKLQKMSTQDLMSGAIGLIIGLIIAFLIGSALSGIPIIGSVIPVLTCIFFGYLGLSLGISKREGIAAFFSGLGRENSNRFRNKGKTRAAGYCNMPKVLDTSVIIDGRIADICKTGFVEGPIVIPNFVLEELRHIADSSDALKRAKGRRGLDILNVIRKELDIEVEISSKDYDDIAEVDDKLVRLAQELYGCVVTNDYNLNKVATLQGVVVLNINELANAIKPVVLPGEKMVVTVVKDGKEHNQGVAYLDDGTMIVVENGRRYMGETIEVEVTSVIQTNAGRMIFGRPCERIERY
ncbi:MAG: PIN/TRAM domain-containing protein [Peptococcaceae bacterium]|nr:PIN/TRAM domain-containing protein [Peptococcaceae bacterium]